MDTFIGVIILLAIVLLLNLGRLKKLRNKYKLRRLEQIRLSDSVCTVYKQILKNNYTDFTNSISALSRSEVYELQKYLSSVKADNSLLRRYAEGHEKNPVALYLLGSSLVDEAWVVRGTGSVNTVDQEQVNQFFHLLQEADATLRSALAIVPDYVEVYAPLIRTQMGMGNLAESWSLYNEAIEIEPGRLDYALAMLLQLTEKWGGSHEQMFEFARNHADCSPALIAVAHHEYWQSLDAKQDKKYYKDKNVQNELLKAHEEIAEAEQVQDYSSRYQNMLAQNYFALIFFLMKNKKKARSIFQSIGKDYTPYPWSYMGHHPGAAYLLYRSMANAGSL